MKAAMSRLGVQPSVVTYSTLINCCVKLGDVSCMTELVMHVVEGFLIRFHSNVTFVPEINVAF